MANITGYHLGQPFKPFGRKIKSALKGAGAGGALGFGALGPAGVIPGALTGGAAGVLGAGQIAKGATEKAKEALKDTPGETHQSPRYTPEQEAQIKGVLDLLINMGKENIQNPYAGFEPIAQNAYNDFFENIVPGIKETFAGIGSSSSPALHTALSGAGASLAERLAAMQSEYGMQNKSQALQQLQLGFNPLTENYFQPPSPGIGRSFLSALPALAGSLEQLYQTNQNTQALQQILRNR